jgi:uncharacterized membrane protein
MANPDFLYVLAASYDTVDAARADYDAVRAIYDRIGVSHEFDAAVLSRDASGKVKIEKTIEAGTRHEALAGLGIGLAAGAAAALFPAIGIGAALLAGGAGGAVIGGMVGHLHTGMKRGDLKSLGEVLDKGNAGLIVVYAGNVADQVAAVIKAENRAISEETDLTADAIAQAIRDADTSAGQS